MALAAAACGSDDSDDGGVDAQATTTEDGATTTADDGDSDVSAGEGDQIALTDPDALPTDMEGWEDLWADQRAAIVQRIEDNGWGVSDDGTTLTGPAGFEMDLTECPSGWSETEGLTDDTIKIGQTLAQSGTLAYAVNYGRGQEAIFDYYTEQGVFTDSEGKTRRIEYIQRDDGYDPARTIPLVDELIDSEKVFAMVTLGSPNTLRTYGKLNDRCIPHLYNQTGHPAWGDPVNHPWTTGLGLAYTTEAVLWGAFIEDHIDEFPDGVTVAALVENNEFGKIYDVGFRAWLDSTEISDQVNYVTQTVEPQAPTIKDPMTTLAAEDPDFFIAMVAGTFCTQAVTEAAENGMHEEVEYLWQPNTCAGSTQLSQEKVGGDGQASQDWWIVNGGNKDIRDPTQQDDPAVVWARDIISEAGYDPDEAAELGLGMIYGWAWTQTLQIAGELEGGLTRSNTILAARALDMNNPMQLPGITFTANGNADSYYTEGGIYQQFEVDQQAYVNRGEVLNLDGSSQNCAFNIDEGVCELY